MKAITLAERMIARHYNGNYEVDIYFIDGEYAVSIYAPGYDSGFTSPTLSGAVARAFGGFRR